jgi:hypothetical protein
LYSAWHNQESWQASAHGGSAINDNVTAIHAYRRLDSPLGQLEPLSTEIVGHDFRHGTSLPHVVFDSTVGWTLESFAGRSEPTGDACRRHHSRNAENPIVDAQNGYSGSTGKACWQQEKWAKVCDRIIGLGVATERSRIPGTNANNSDRCAGVFNKDTQSGKL